MISLTYSKTLRFLSFKEKKHESVNNESQKNLYVSIQVNPFENQQRILDDDDDDDELIKSDLTTNFCDNDLIELRLDDNDADT